MKKWGSILALLAVTQINHAQERVLQDYRVVRVFGPAAVNLAHEQIHLIQELLHALDTSSLKERYQAALFLDRYLLQEKQVVSSILEKKTREGAVIPLVLVQQHLVLEIQITQLKKISESLAAKLSLFDRARAWLSVYRNRHRKISVDLVTKLLQDYYDMVRIYITPDYNRTLAFFAAQSKHMLPAFLSLGEDAAERALIMHYADSMRSVVKAQFFETLLELALQMSVFSGQQLATQLFSQEDQATYKAIQNRLKKLEQDFQQFQSNLGHDNKQFIKTLYDGFNEQQKQVQKQADQARSQLNEEIVYLNRSIGLDKPRPQYLAPLQQCIMYDRLFAAARMTSSPGNTIWYNIYQGNWYFDQERHQYIQRSLVPLAPKTALQNNIFTEFIPAQTPYTIEADITLIAVEYPFFAGIQFNQARWISGSSERMQSFRVLGLYGYQQDNKATIELRFGQSSITTNAQGATVIRNGLQDIIETSSGSILHTLSEAATSNLGKDPLTLRVTIDNDILALQVTLSKVASTVEQLFTQSITNLDPQQSRSLFWYHGIGFFSPGCQAAFALRQPSTLIATRGRQKR